VAALAQNGDGLRADQAGAADDDDLHGLPSLVDEWKLLNGFDASEDNARHRRYDHCGMAAKGTRPCSVSSIQNISGLSQGPWWPPVAG
jgi:hypothetical protein